MEQLIISIGREFGSGGHEIGERLAKRFQIPFYDHHLMEEIAEIRNLDPEVLAKYDEKNQPSPLITRTVRGMSNDHVKNIAEIQFDYMRKMAADGKSFVIIGRCSEEVLKGNPALISFFMIGDMDKKIQRIQRIYKVSEDKAREMIQERNKKRMAYHNTYCKMKWGDARNYDLCINTSRMDIDRIVDFIEHYIQERMKEALAHAAEISPCIYGWK